MGVRHLNQYLIRKCGEANKSHFIKTTTLKEWEHKCIVVDTSIFLYKFMEKKVFLEHFFLMISSLRKHHIHPIFVFDGKPPIQKKHILLKRKTERQKAEQQYLCIRQQYDALFYNKDENNDDDDDDDDDDEQDSRLVKAARRPEDCLSASLRGLDKSSERSGEVVRDGYKQSGKSPDGYERSGEAVREVDGDAGSFNQSGEEEEEEEEDRCFVHENNPRAASPFQVEDLSKPPGDQRTTSPLRSEDLSSPRIVDERHFSETSLRLEEAPSRPTASSEATKRQSKEEMERELRRLEKRFVKIKQTDIDLLKELLRAYQIPIIQCEGEADAMCAFLVHHRFADACMSDDMDLLIHGCPVVLRHYNVGGGQQEIVEYNTLGIVEETLHLSLREFQVLMILSGTTDYFAGPSKYSLEEMMFYYSERKETAAPSSSYMSDFLRRQRASSSSSSSATIDSFCDWFLSSKQNGHTLKDFKEVIAIFQRTSFIQTNKEVIKREVIDQMPFFCDGYGEKKEEEEEDNNNNIRIHDIQRILRLDGFLFL